MVVRSRIGIGLQQVRVRRGVAKVSRKWRNFGCAGSESCTVGGGPYENLFHTIGEQRDRCMIRAVFEPKRRFRLVLLLSERWDLHEPAHS
jgi:hypothetical protein